MKLSNKRNIETDTKTNEKNSPLLLDVEFSLDKKVIDHLLKSLSFFTLISGFINYLLGLGKLLILIPILNPLLLFIALHFARNSKNWRTFYMIILFFQGYFFNLLLWFSTDGINGSTAFTIIMFGVATVVFAENSKKIISATLYIIFYLALIVIQYFNPSIVNSYPNDLVKYFDIGVGMVIAYLFFVQLTDVITKEYKQVIDFTTNVVNNLEEKNMALEKTKIKMNTLIKKLEETSYTDALTGISNRAFLVGEINKLMAYSNKTNQPLTLVIIDIDHFKRINDTYGHIFGDKVLVKIVSTIKEHLESNEVLGRFGGEEFIILYPRTDLKEGVSKCEKFHKSIENISWDIANLKVTISCGLALYKPDQTFEEFVDEADGNLYRAKQGGRNKIEY